VEELAAAHGGRVAILSQAGRGATVTVTLPIVEP
jgi:signal transduction histidine kinase